MAIAFVQAATNSGAATSVTVTLSTSAGSCLVAVICSDDNTRTVTSITDTFGNTWTKVAAVNGTNGRVELWSTAANGTGAVTSVTVNLSSALADWAIAVGEYSGVSALGINGTNTGSSTGPTIALTTQDANNFSVAGFAIDANPTITASVGNLRTHLAFGTHDSVALNDNTSASAGSVTNTISLSVTHTWAAAALELRSTTGGSTVIVVDDPDAQQQRFVSSTRMESQHQQELQETFAIPPGLPPFAFEDDGQNMRWVDWRALQHDDTDTHRALPPIPPVSIQEEFSEPLNFDWRARQYEDTDTHRALPPTPPFAIQDEHQDKKNVSWSAIQYEDLETQRALPPTPPPAIQDEISEIPLPGVVPFLEEDQPGKPIVAAPAPNIGLDDIEAHIKAFDRVSVYHEDDWSTLAPTPPVSIQDDEQHTWRGWLAPAIEDDWRALPPVPPFVVPDDTAEKWTATSAPAIEDDQATLPPLPPIVPFSIQDDEQHTWRGWFAPAIDDDWSARAPIPPFAFEDDLKTVSSSQIFFPIVDTDFTGIPPVPSPWSDDEPSLQRYVVAGLSGLVILDEFVNAPIAGVGPASLTSLSASVRPAIDVQSAAIRAAIDSQNAATRPAIDSESATVRPS